MGLFGQVVGAAIMETGDAVQVIVGLALAQHPDTAYSLLADTGKRCRRSASP
jgi:hypothetical protein